MDQPFPENYKDIADNMGIALYQKFSLNEASLFLRCSESDINKLINGRQLNTIKRTNNNYQFFGYQLLEYILGQATDHKAAPSNPKLGDDRIIRARDAQEMTGLSRTTLWRFENKGEFLRRISLGARTVGWKLSEVQNWIQERQ